MRQKIISGNCIKRFAVILLLSGFIIDCGNRDTAGREQKSSLLSILTTAGAPADVTNACLGAIQVLNTCIAEGYGFNSATMCHREVTKYFTASDYNTLSNCAATVKATTSCHLNQNKFPNAASAFSNTTFLTAGVSGTASFSSCNKTATTSNGQTINIMVY